MADKTERHDEKDSEAVFTKYVPLDAKTNKECHHQETTGTEDHQPLEMTEVC